MFLLHRPTREKIDRFIAASQTLPLSYSPVGMLRDGAPGYDRDETVAVIGRGEADFERARAALAAWKQFDVGWVELWPRAASCATGTVVGVLIRHLGFWSLHGCRVVYHADTNECRFGFAYGTLPNHAETGEESFEVWRDRRTNEVMYRIQAMSRPRAALARLGYPLARHFQARFRRESVEAMTRAISDNA
jgi:uncharacterized protein (UPF0548 family)